MASAAFVGITMLKDDEQVGHDPPLVPTRDERRLIFRNRTKDIDNADLKHTVYCVEDTPHTLPVSFQTYV